MRSFVGVVIFRVDVEGRLSEGTSDLNDVDGSLTIRQIVSVGLKVMIGFFRTLHLEQS